MFVYWIIINTFPLHFYKVFFTPIRIKKKEGCLHINKTFYVLIWKKAPSLEPVIFPHFLRRPWWTPGKENKYSQQIVLPQRWEMRGPTWETAPQDAGTCRNSDECWWWHEEPWGMREDWETTNGQVVF